MITWALTLFGAAGIIGSMLFTKMYDKHRFSFLRLTTVGMAISLFALYFAAASVWTVFLVCALWGMSATAFTSLSVGDNGAPFRQALQR